MTDDLITPQTQSRDTVDKILLNQSKCSPSSPPAGCATT